MSRPNRVKSFTVYLTILAIGLTLGSSFQCGGDQPPAEVKYLTDYLTDTVFKHTMGPIRHTYSVDVRIDSVPVYITQTKIVHDTTQITSETPLNAHYATDTSVAGLRIEDSIFVFANTVVALTRGIQLDTARWFKVGYRDGVNSVKIKPARQRILGLDMGIMYTSDRSVVIKSGLDFSNNRGWGLNAGYIWQQGPYAGVRVPLKRWDK